MIKDKNIKVMVKNCVLLLVFFAFYSCSYSFTGSTLKEEKTIQINDFVNNAALVNPTLAQQFYTDIQNRFLQKARLKGTKENPDILLEGEITDYTITPTTISSAVNAPGGNVQAAQNKLTITVKVHYENHTAENKDKSFDRTYSDEVVFSSEMEISQIEATQVKIVNERIINKIYNDIVANW